MPGSDTLTFYQTRDAPRLGDSADRKPVPLEIRLFGPMEVRLCGLPLPRLRTRKGLWLLAILALRGGRGVERDWVAGTLWPDSDEADARRSLRQSLHDLRLALGPEAERLEAAARRTLHLDLADADCDVAAFDDAFRRGDPASLAHAAARYRGPLLLGCLEEWALPERESRERAALTALESLAAGARERGDLADAAARLAHALEVDPLRETALRALLETLAEQGSHAAAAEAYHAFRRRLRDELNADPDPETVALYRRLQSEARQSPPRKPPIPHSAPVPSGLAHLPVPLTSLIGRGPEVEAVAAHLAGARLVTLTGTGGVGKTRLALAVAQRLSLDFADGAGFADLAPLTDPRLVAPAVLAALGVSEQPGHPPSDALTEFLLPRRLLLVLDNCEHLMPDCALLARELLERCPALHLLATSREPLGVAGEVTWRVPSLSLPDGTGGAATWSEAVRLFVERARQGRPGWTPSASEHREVASICRRLDGIPLAIELAAARVRSLSVEDIRARLGEGFGLLSGGGRTLLPRQQTLAATFDWGWDLLPPPERALLGRLSVFAGGWGLDAAEAVGAGGEGLRAGDVVDLLTALVDKSLVVYRPPGEGTQARYFLLETVRQYAGERLREGGGGDEARDRHRDFFLRWAEEIAPELWREEQNRWFRCLETDHDNLRAALEWCRSQSADEQEIRMVAVLGRFWNTHGHTREGRVRLDDALSRMTPRMPPHPCIKALLHAGWTAHVLSDRPEARRRYEQALALIRENGFRTMLSQPLNYLAAVAKDEGDYDTSESLFKEALTLCRELGQPAQLAAVLNNLSGLAILRQDYDEAQKLVEESITWSLAAGTPQMHGLGLLSLAVIDFHRRRREEAQAHCVMSLRLFQESGATVNIPDVLDRMAQLAQTRACAERAAVLLGAAAGVRDALGVTTERDQEHHDFATEAECALGTYAFAAAFAEGRAMDLAQAVAFALAGADGRALSGHVGQ